MGRDVRMSQPAIILADSLAVMGSDDFESAFKREVAALDVKLLPLHQAMVYGSYPAESPISAVLLNTTEKDDLLLVKAGVFFSSVLAGCNCAGDPSAENEYQEYCQLLFSIDRQSGETEAVLLPDDTDGA